MSGENKTVAAVIELREPIQRGTELITKLELRKPKAKDLRKLPMQLDTGDLLNLAGALCGQPPSVIDELGMEDTSELLDTVGNFMAPGQPTGGKR